MSIKESQLRMLKLILKFLINVVNMGLYNKILTFKLTS